MKSWIVHLMNVYPGAQIAANDMAIDVHHEGQHKLALRKADGQWIDAGAELGLPDRFSLSPIPKEARVHKLHKNGSIGLDDEAEARMQAREAFRCEKSKRILSIEECQAKAKAEAAKKSV